MREFKWRPRAADCRSPWAREHSWPGLLLAVFLGCTRTPPGGLGGVGGGGIQGGAAGVIDNSGAGGAAPAAAGTATAPEAETGSGDGGSEWQEGACRHPKVAPACQNGYCRIPSGCFIIGSPATEWGRALNSETPTPITLTHPFEIAEHELTQGEWTLAGFVNPSGAGANTASCLDAKCPVGNVSVFDVAAYANYWSEHASPPLPVCYRLDACQGLPGSGMTCASLMLTTATAYDCLGYRLPTGPEWEYAAKAGTRTAFYSGPITEHDLATADDCYAEPGLEAVAWYCKDAPRQPALSTSPVGGKGANPWGLYDMLGNAFEFTSTGPVRGHGYEGTAATNPGGTLGTLDGSTPGVAVRGGGANSPPRDCRAADGGLTATFTDRTPAFGFRLARSLE
ncbi:MAG: formylglycine-generating enzyme family protein [Pseudomonadota bacterium]